MSEIVVERIDQTQIIRINRPDKKNALNAAMYTAITDGLQSGEADAGVAVHVITGSGGTFSAGNDIADFLAGGARLAEPTVAFLRLLPTLDKPLIAAVDGLAVGIGTTILFHTDYAVASPASRFLTPFLNLGVVPEAGSSLLAPRRLGSHRAFELLILGETWSAEQAERYGLVNAVVPVGEVEAHALDVARRLAAKPPAALAASRRLVRGDPSETRARIDEEVAIFAERLASPEAKEAFAAFLEKRPPRFTRN